MEDLRKQLVQSIHLMTELRVKTELLTDDDSYWDEAYWDVLSEVKNIKAEIVQRLRSK